MHLRWPAVSLRELATSAALGLLAVFLLRELGAFDLLGFQLLGPWISMGIAAGIVLVLLRWERVLIVADLVLVAVYLIVAFTPVVRGPVERWVRNDPLPSKPLDAVVVLSGWVKSDSALNTDGLERLLTGLQLVKNGVAPRLITTRVVAGIDGVRITSDEGQRSLVRLAGLEGAGQWSEVDSAATTRDEASRVASLLGGAAPHDVAVVTSPLHTRRACATFEGIGFRVTCVAAKESHAVTWHPGGANDRLAAFRDYVYERLGTVKYRFKGWLK